MPRGGKFLPLPQIETPDWLRAMADRARRLAMGISSDEAAIRLLEFATELQARAEALEIGEVKPPDD
jgi:hypothetical protein